jgi:hypothetical protein
MALLPDVYLAYRAGITLADPPGQAVVGVMGETPRAGGSAQTQAARPWVKAQLIASEREETLSFS